VFAAMRLPPPAPESTALVTGASAGIGAELARELARRGHGVTLVARREDRLRALADELERDHGVRAEVVAASVSERDQRQELAAEIERRGLTVEVLVNNAGFGSGGRFQRLDPEREEEMVRTNVEAVVGLCGLYVPKMVARGRGAILNVGSVAGFQPVPRQVTYSATKAFVNSFTEGLHTDLSGTGVTATVLCPGFTRTEFADVANLGDLDRLPSFLIDDAPEVARAGVEGMDKGRRAVVPGPHNVATAVGGRLAPRSLLLPALQRFYRVGR
jgi:short-subunit dehydrogenase